MLAWLAWMLVAVATLVFGVNVAIYAHCVRTRNHVSAMPFVPTVIATPTMLLYGPMRPYAWVPIACELSLWAVLFAIWRLTRQAPSREP